MIDRNTIAWRSVQLSEAPSSKLDKLQAVGYNRSRKRRKIMSKVSPMSEEFHDWLDSCPVQWFRGAVSKGHVAYYFETPDKDVNDEENEDDSN